MRVYVFFMIRGSRCLGTLKERGYTIANVEAGGGRSFNATTSEVEGGGGGLCLVDGHYAGGLDHIHDSIEDQTGGFVVGIGESVEGDAQTHATAAENGVGGYGDGGLHRGTYRERNGGFENAIVVPVEIDEGGGSGTGCAIEFHLQRGALSAIESGAAAREEGVALRFAGGIGKDKRLQSFFAGELETEQTRGVGGDTGKVVDLQTAGECGTQGAEAEGVVAVEGELSVGGVEMIGTVGGFAHCVGGAVVEGFAVGSVHNAVAALGSALKIPRIGIDFRAFAPRQGAVGLLLEHFVIDVDQGIERLVAGGEGTQFVAIVGGLEPPIRPDVGVAGVPCDDVRRGTVFVQTARTVRRLVVVVTIGRREIPSASGLGLGIVRYIIRSGRGGGANARSAAGREVARGDIVLRGRVAHVVNIGFSLYGDQRPELFARIVAFAHDQAAFIVLGDEETAVVVPRDAINFVFGRQGMLRKKTKVDDRRQQQAEQDDNLTEREMIHIRVLGCFFEQCTGQRLRTVTFDKFVDAGNPLFSGASANEDEEDVENEIVDGVIGEGIVERGTVDDENQPIGGLFEMQVGTNRALCATNLQKGAQAVEKLFAHLLLEGDHRGEGAQFARIIRIDTLQIVEFELRDAEKDFQSVVGMSFDLGSPCAVVGNILFHTGQHQSLFAVKQLIEGAFRDAKAFRDVVHRHITNALGSEKLIRLADHIPADPFVALCKQFVIHCRVSEGAKIRFSVRRCAT